LGSVAGKGVVCQNCVQVVAQNCSDNVEIL
jgi:hypothetical protein